jgi:hypothetical protein
MIFNVVILSLNDTPETASVVYWLDFLAEKPEVPSSISGAARFSDYQCVWYGIHSALVKINVVLYERKVAAAV